MSTLQWIVSIGDNIIDADKLRGDQEVFTDEGDAKEFTRDKLKRGVQFPDGQILVSSGDLVAWITASAGRLR